MEQIRQYLEYEKYIWAVSFRNTHKFMEKYLFVQLLFAIFMGATAIVIDPFNPVEPMAQGAFISVVSLVMMSYAVLVFHTLIAPCDIITTQQVTITNLTKALAAEKKKSKKTKS